MFLIIIYHQNSFSDLFAYTGKGMQLIKLIMNLLVKRGAIYTEKVSMIFIDILSSWLSEFVYRKTLK